VEGEALGPAKAGPSVNRILGEEGGNGGRMRSRTPI